MTVWLMIIIDVIRKWLEKEKVNNLQMTTMQQICKAIFIQSIRLFIIIVRGEKVEEKKSFMGLAVPLKK